MSMKRNEFTEAQRKWIAALRSGKYRQTFDAFCDGYGHCCLAVATHALDPESKALDEGEWFKAHWENSPIAMDDPEWFDGLEDGGLAPPNVVAELNLYGTDGRFRFGVQVVGQNGLSGLNDNAQWSFSEIADLIEAKPWLVFTNFDMPSAEVTP